MVAYDIFLRKKQDNIKAVIFVQEITRKRLNYLKHLKQRNIFNKSKLDLYFGTTFKEINGRKRGKERVYNIDLNVTFI